MTPSVSTILHGQTYGFYPFFLYGAIPKYATIPDITPTEPAPELGTVQLHQHSGMPRLIKIGQTLH